MENENAGTTGLKASMNQGLDRLAAKRRVWQRSTADKLQAASEKISPKAKKRLLLLTVLLCVTVISGQLWHSLQPGEVSSLVTGKIETLILPEINTGVLDQELYQRILRFEAHLDSLDQTAEGRKVLEHLVATRPGLLDSVLRVKRMYERKNKKEINGKENKEP